MHVVRQTRAAAKEKRKNAPGLPGERPNSGDLCVVTAPGRGLSSAAEGRFSPRRIRTVNGRFKAGGVRGREPGVYAPSRCRRQGGSRGAAFAARWQTAGLERPASPRNPDSQDIAPPPAAQDVQESEVAAGLRLRHASLGDFRT